MKLKVTILQREKNNLGFRVENDTKGIWEITDCNIKNPYILPFESYYGALAVIKGGFNEGHPVHLNQIRQNDWELWIDES